MSAGQDSDALVNSSLDGLAPAFADAIMAALAECATAGLDAIVYESLRSDELQRIYYARGRTVVPPHDTVTNAPSAQYGWHFFGLAVDVISASKRWDAGDAWNLKVGAIMRSHGLKCGQDWAHPDIPHYQFGKCTISPTNETRALYAQGGNPAVWAALGASI
jgi:peptidoglycan L-alanyl-D-glutamate endopeptidase CwlK